MRIATVLVMMTGVAAAQPADLQAHADWTKSTGTIGIMTDVGVPDGATASLAIRPMQSVRFEIGAAENLVSPGVRGGITYLPLSGWFTPTLSVSYGKFFERNANGVVQTVLNDRTISSPMLEKIGYDYASARVGVELGKKYFTFFLHAGVSRVTGDVHGLNQVADENTAQATNSSISITTTDPKVTAWGVSANLGFIFYVH